MLDVVMLSPSSSSVTCDALALDAVVWWGEAHSARSHIEKEDVLYLVIFRNAALVDVESPVQDGRSVRNNGTGRRRKHVNHTTNGVFYHICVVCDIYVHALVVPMI